MKFIANRAESDALELHSRRIRVAVRIHEKYSHGFVPRDCPICGSASHSPFDTFMGRYGIARCDLCLSRFVNPAPSPEAVREYYNDESVNELLRAIYQRRFQEKTNFIRDDKVDYVMECIDEHIEGEFKILEIGCNSGWMLSRLRSALQEKHGAGTSLSLTGIDLDKTAIRNAVDREIAFHNVSAEEFVETSSEQFDFILHFDLMEHLSDPGTFLSRCRLLLKPGGRMVFTCPNIEGLEMLLDYNSPRPLAHALFPPMHLNGFSTHNITHFLLRHGFAVERLDTPGKLDVEIVKLFGQNAKNPDLRFVSGLTPEQMDGLQNLLVALKASSHMACVARALED